MSSRDNIATYGTIKAAMTWRQTEQEEKLDGRTAEHSKTNR